jgi:endonuclease YncB( thermonuclease family)
VKHLVVILLCWTVLIHKPATAVDGDTFDSTFEIWHRITVFERVRVLEIDTPEMKKETKARAMEAKAFTQDWLNRGPFQIFTCDRDSFGRVLGRVYRGGNVLADDLKKAGHIK